MKNLTHSIITTKIILLSMLFFSCKTGSQDHENTTNTASGKVIKSELLNFMAEEIITGIDVPWGMAWLPNGDMLITERSGKLYRFSDGKLSEPIEGVPEVFSDGQGGLLDVELHPDYENNSWIYMAYSCPSPENAKESNTAIMRAKISDNQLVEQEKIFQALPFSDKGHHFGCRLEFDKEGYLFFSVGDRGAREVNPQSLENHCGKVHRILDDGSIPTDNPFVNTKGAMQSIYSYGHRNVQGISMHPETGEIWTHEHGPKGGDEINIVEPGKNYGWPVITYGINYNGTIITNDTAMAGMEQPLFYWTPSIAPCGMDFIDGDIYPAWKGNLLVGSLSFMYLERLEVENKQVVHREKLLEGTGRVRNVEMGPDGFIYVAIETPGKILRLIPVND